MKKWFVIGVLGLVFFELANVWFIMPLPYSQRVRSIDVAYALYSWRWAIRALFATLTLIGIAAVWQIPNWRRWFVPIAVMLAGGVAYLTNFVMSADHMFLMPSQVTMATAKQNIVEKNRLVVGVEINGESRAYPVQFIGYHHQVQDTVGGEPILVTFCTVCRTGRVFSPKVRGVVQQFRLVGMDHFNAMLEDAATKSWWRQATGEAVSGPMVGDTLREIPSQQVSLALWLEMHPLSRVMQADEQLRDKYAKSFDYETGASRSALTGTDTASWKDKSWVIGVTVGGQSRAYDWQQLRRARAINDVVAGTPLVIVLASDGASYFVYARPDSATHLAMRGDSIVSASSAYGLSGRGANGSLTPLQASQEFWHSWRTFQPHTDRYLSKSLSSSP